MKLTTSKGKTFTIDWMWGPVGADNSLMIQFSDDRTLSKIAKDFEGCDHFHRESETEGNMDFDGYTVLAGITRPSYSNNPSTVMLTLNKPKNT